MQQVESLTHLIELYDIAFSSVDGCVLCGGKATGASACGHSYCEACTAGGKDCECHLLREIASRAGRKLPGLMAACEWSKKWAKGEGHFVPSTSAAEVALELRLLGEQVVSREIQAICVKILEKKLPRLLRDAGTGEPYMVIGYTLGQVLSRQQEPQSRSRRTSVTGSPQSPKSTLSCRDIASDTLQLMNLAHDDSPIEELEAKVLDMAATLCDPLTAKRPFIVALRGHEAEVKKILHKMGVPPHYEETLRKCCAEVVNEVQQDWSLHQLVEAMQSVKRIANLAQQAKVLMFPRPAEAKQRLKQFKKILLELATFVLPEDEDIVNPTESTDMSTFSPLSFTSSTQSNLSFDDYSSAEKQVAVYFGRFDYEGEGLLRDREDVEMLITSLCVKLSIDMNLDDLPAVMPTPDQIPVRGWTLELFKRWFMDKFFMDHCSCYSSPTTTPVDTPRDSPSSSRRSSRPGSIIKTLKVLDQTEEPADGEDPSSDEEPSSSDEQPDGYLETDELEI